MRIVVSDSSCIIDLNKVSLLDVFLRLPYEIVAPDTLFEEDLLHLAEAQKRTLIEGGLKVIDLPGERVLRAQQLLRSAPRLAVRAAFAFALAEIHPSSILLTNDGCLRDLAITHQIEVHGCLWIVDEIHRHRLGAAAELRTALRLLDGDPSVRLPKGELAAIIQRFEGL
jgi:predicted nucleic acid-binding protein